MQAEDVLAPPPRQIRHLHPVEGRVLDAWGEVGDEEFVVTLTIQGNPVSQKNSKMVTTNRATGKPLVLHDKRVQQWFGTKTKPGAVWQLKMLWQGAQPIPAHAHVRAIVTAYLGARQRPDADNLLAAPLDAMVAAGVLKDDKCIDVCLVVRRRARKENETCVEIVLVTDVMA